MAIRPQPIREKTLFIFSVYKEQKIIRDTLSHYELFLKDNPIDILFVCSPEKGKLTTIKALTKAVKESKWKKRIKIITYPSPYATKAIKINFALRNVRISKYRYYVVFDADARVSLTDFQKAQYFLYSRQDTYVFSFIPLAYRNSPSLAVNIHRANHLLRVVLIEIGKTLFPSYVTYPMGATMIMRQELFKFIKRLPEPIDDLPLGQIMNAKKITFMSLPFYTKVQAAPDMKNLYRSYIVVFTGALSVINTLKQFKMGKIIYILPQLFFIFLFYILEFLFPIWGIVRAIAYGDITILLLYLSISSISLYTLKEFSIKQLAYCLIGHFIKLSTFLNYLRSRIFLSNVALSSYKSERV